MSFLLGLQQPTTGNQMVGIPQTPPPVNPQVNTPPGGQLPMRPPPPTPPQPQQGGGLLSMMGNEIQQRGSQFNQPNFLNWYDKQMNKIQSDIIKTLDQRGKLYEIYHNNPQYHDNPKFQNMYDAAIKENKRNSRWYGGRIDKFNQYVSERYPNVYAEGWGWTHGKAPTKGESRLYATPQRASDISPSSLDHRQANFDRYYDMGGSTYIDPGPGGGLGADQAFPNYTDVSTDSFIEFVSPNHLSASMGPASPAPASPAPASPAPVAASTGGGISSLPRKTTLGGQEHMLSYITPTEARMLRQQGGGVTPTGGQYRGPGGVPAFRAPGNPGVAGGGTGAPGSSSGAGGPGTGTFGGFGGAGLGSNPGAQGIAGIHGGHGQGNVGSTGVGQGGGQHGVPGDTDSPQTKAEVALAPKSYAPYGDSTIDALDAAKAAKRARMLAKHYSLLAKNAFDQNRQTGQDTDGDGVPDAPQSFSPSQFGQAVLSNPMSLGDAAVAFGKAALGFVAPPLGLALSLGEAISGDGKMSGLAGVAQAALSGDMSSFSPAQTGLTHSIGQLGPKGGGNLRNIYDASAKQFKQDQIKNINPIVQQAVSTPAITVEEQETISQVPTSLSGIVDRYIGTPVTAQGGGGIQNLINRQNQNYGVANQDSFIPNKEAFTRQGFTPNKELMDSSYMGNITQGHTVPMGMHSAQQPTKSFDPFPSGGQMNNDNTQYANFSKAQSFYAMPNMNRVT